MTALPDLECPHHSRNGHVRPGAEASSSLLRAGDGIDDAFIRLNAPQIRRDRLSITPQAIMGGLQMFTSVTVIAAFAAFVLVSASKIVGNITLALQAAQY